LRGSNKIITNDNDNDENQDEKLEETKWNRLSYKSGSIMDTVGVETFIAVSDHLGYGWKSKG
jgi:hypothetical protein